MSASSLTRDSAVSAGRLVYVFGGWKPQSIQMPFLPPHPDLKYALIHRLTSGLGFSDQCRNSTSDTKHPTSNCCLGRTGRHKQIQVCSSYYEKQQAKPSPPSKKKANHVPCDILILHSSWRSNPRNTYPAILHQDLVFSVYFHFSKPLKQPKQYAATTEQHRQHGNIFKKQ